MQMTPKQLSFIHEYLVDKNATQAAIRAGYSAKTAAEQGVRLLKNVKFKTEIDKLLNNCNEDAYLDAVKLRREISRLAFSDPRRILREDGTVKMPNELDDDTAAAIASFEISADGSIKYKFWDKNSAQERACKIRGQFKEDNEQAGKMTVTISQDDSGLV